MLALRMDRSAFIKNYLAELAGPVEADIFDRAGFSLQAGGVMPPKCPSCSAPVPVDAGFCPTCGYKISTDSEPVEPIQSMLERALGAQYRMLRQLGRGGMGAV